MIPLCRNIQLKTKTGFNTITTKLLSGNINTQVTSLLVTFFILLVISHFKLKFIKVWQLGRQIAHLGGRVTRDLWSLPKPKLCSWAGQSSTSHNTTFADILSAIKMINKQKLPYKNLVKSISVNKTKNELNLHPTTREKMNPIQFPQPPLNTLQIPNNFADSSYWEE